MIARRVAEQYWPQVRPYPAGDRTVVLRQITNKQSTIVNAVGGLTSQVGAIPFSRVEAVAPSEFEAMLDAVELTVARYPLRLLQTVDNVAQPFLYDVDWSEGVSLSHLRKDGWVRFRPGAGDHLVRLAPLVRPLVELHWSRMVAALNHIALGEQRLREHLFGVERRAFPAALRAGLADVQAGECSYCGRPLPVRADVDHFIPWARYPNDAIENLVLADFGCNNHKRDHIAGVALLGRWCERLRDCRDELVDVAATAKWQVGRERTLGLTRSVNAHLPAGAPLWGGPGLIEPADTVVVAEALALCR